jgi:hypothetical protein
MAAPAISQPLKSNPVSNLASNSALRSPEPSAIPEPFMTLLLESEDARSYDGIFTRISAAVKPADFLEEIWVHDVAALVWEAFRMRRLKARLMEAAAPRGLVRVLSSFLSHETAKEIVVGWARDGRSTKQIKKLLDQSGVTMEHVMAETLAERIEDIERIDRMIASAELRRGAMLREVDRHRAGLASRLRLASDEVVEAEFEDVAPRQAGRAR